MCGLAGEFVRSSGRKLAPQDLFAMIDVLAHRGPESAGYWMNAGHSAILLHARLAFVDLLNGRQPLSDDAGRFWLSLNGELYDHRRIRSQLEDKGHRLASTCDAEIVPHLFQDRGVASFAKLRGEFAFALVDQTQHELFLVRDRFGVKPLFYTLTKDGVVFGSEIKSLLMHPNVSAEPDRAYLRQSLLSLGLPDQTWLKGIRQVKPGHYLHVTRAKVEEKPYWSASFSGQNKFRSIDEAAERFRELLDDAVRLRLDADVEIGSYLSGGLDSSAIAQSMVKQAAYPIKTFSIRYQDTALDEAETAASTAEFLGAQNTQVRVTDEALAESFIPSLWHAENIAANSHVTAKYLLSAETGRHVKAVMTGEGSDELFAGYGFFAHQSLIEAQRAGEDCEDALQSLLDKSAMTPGIVPLKGYRKHGLVTRLYGQYPYQALRAIALDKAISHFLTKDFAAELNIEDALRRHAQWFPEGAMHDLQATRASQYAWIKSELPAYLLTNLGDRPEMANSVEGRVPFLDNEIADFALGLPMEWLANSNGTKQIIRHAMKDVLPENVTRPAKNIFWCPPSKEETLIRSSACSDYLTMKAIRKAGIFDPLKLSAAKHMMRVIPASSKLGSGLRSLLVTAASTHILLDLFTGDIKRHASAFTCKTKRWQNVEAVS